MFAVFGYVVIDPWRSPQSHNQDTADL